MILENKSHVKMEQILRRTKIDLKHSLLYGLLSGK